MKSFFKRDAPASIFPVLGKRMLRSTKLSPAVICHPHRLATALTAANPQRRMTIAITPARLMSSPCVTRAMRSVALHRTYREAVRLGWDLRASQNMTRATLAECIGAYASHVTDYFHKDDAPFRRNLPPELINDFEWAVGNRAVTQYLARKAELTIMEEVIATRAA